MSYTPVELRHVRVGRSLLGYNRATVEQLIEEVAQSFEATWRQRGELADMVESLEKQVADLRGREHLLTQTLVAAEQAASDVRERARREAETIIREAHNEARAISRAAQSRRERLLVESKRIEGLMRAALGVMELDSAPVAEALPPAAVPAHPTAVTEPEPVPDPGPFAEDEPAPEPIVRSEPEPFVDHEPDPADQDEYLEAPPVHLPEPEFESEYGWAREDTREFEPISSLPEPVPLPGAEPERNDNGPARAAANPFVERIPASGSHDFDWGE